MSPSFPPSLSFPPSPLTRLLAILTPFTRCGIAWPDVVWWCVLSRGLPFHLFLLSGSITLLLFYAITARLILVLLELRTQYSTHAAGRDSLSRLPSHACLSCLVMSCLISSSPLSPPCTAVTLLAPCWGYSSMLYPYLPLQRDGSDRQLLSLVFELRACQHPAVSLFWPCHVTSRFFFHISQQAAS